MNNDVTKFYWKDSALIADATSKVILTYGMFTLTVSLLKEATKPWRKIIFVSTVKVSENTSDI